MYTINWQRDTRYPGGLLTTQERHTRGNIHWLSNATNRVHFRHHWNLDAEVCRYEDA